MSSRKRPSRLSTSSPRVTSYRTPAELLTSSRLPELIDRMRELYDFVVVDSPPILAVTDPAILSSVADGVILIVRANTLRHHDAEATLERINTLGTSVLGMVVNATVQEEIRYGYGCRNRPARRPERSKSCCARWVRTIMVFPSTMPTDIHLPARALHRSERT